MYTIRPARPEDAAALSAIYAPYVKDTSITFEYDPPTPEEFAVRIRNISETHPYFVCLDGDTPIGYAYATHFRTRTAYDWDVETSIYVDMAHRHNGIGRLLYAALEDALRKQGIVNLYACVTSPNPDSIAFHTALGFNILSVFPRAGFKHGRWHDVTWLCKQINEYQNPPKEILPWNGGNK